MGLVQSTTDSGLILMESEDGAAVARALQALDPRLSLRCDPNRLWRVYFNDQGRDVFILAWEDAEGKPLPLSSRLIDKVQERDRAGRGEPRDADAMNAELERKMQKQRENDIEAIRSEYEPALKSKRVSVPMPEKPW